jgi:hypothetical protein
MNVCDLETKINGGEGFGKVLIRNNEKKKIVFKFHRSIGNKQQNKLNLLKYLLSKKKVMVWPTCL